MSQVRVAETEVENWWEDWKKISVPTKNQTQDPSLHLQARFPYATTAT